MRWIEAIGIKAKWKMLDLKRENVLYLSSRKSTPFYHGYTGNIPCILPLAQFYSCLGFVSSILIEHPEGRPP
jgi:hypothetical protein